MRLFCVFYRIQFLLLAWQFMSCQTTSAQERMNEYQESVWNFYSQLLLPNASTSFGLFGDTQCEISFTDTLSLQTIDTIPDEIDGGMCQLFLSEYDKKVNSPFCITDMGDVLFIYVDGELNKLRQDSIFSSRLFQYRNDKYLMKIYIHEGETEDEQCDIKGFCKINSLNSLRVYEHSFIGKCIW